MRFLPAVFLLYTVIPSLKVRNALLLAASLVFYAYGEPIYVLIMIASAVLNCVCALLSAKEKSAKASVAAAVIINLGINLGMLAVFKYAGSFVQSVNGLLGCTIPVPQIDLPIGISFFTFQALSYVIDVYRKTVKPQKNFFYVLLYITFFRSLLQVRLLSTEMSTSRLRTDIRK